MPDQVIAATDAAVRTTPTAPDQDFATDSVTIPVKLCNLPPFHSVANQVLALSADPNVDLKRLSTVMESDPAFAAEVLFLANSSLFGFTSRMHVLRHAVAVLGLDRIKALAVTVAMRAFLGTGGPLVRQCWQHSAACAVVAEEISAIFDFSGNHAYTLGLMHDVGRLGLVKSYAPDMTPVLNAEYGNCDEVLAAEKAAVSVDHGTAGSWLVKTWGLPQDFADICTHHHDAIAQTDPALLKVVKGACRIADALGFSAIKYREPITYQRVVACFPVHQQRRFPDEAELREAVQNRLSSVQG